MERRLQRPRTMSSQSDYLLRVTLASMFTMYFVFAYICHSAGTWISHLSQHIEKYLERVGPTKRVSVREVLARGFSSGSGSAAVHCRKIHHSGVLHLCPSLYLGT